jgi:hypothetical protein
MITRSEAFRAQSILGFGKSTLGKSLPLTYRLSNSAAIKFSAFESTAALLEPYLKGAQGHPENGHAVLRAPTSVKFSLVESRWH